jgi:peptidyl-dipeptidase Dcp
LSNPFFEPWTTPFQAPPFDKIKTEHFRPAYARALEEHRAQIGRIAAAPCDFESVIVALEDSGRALARVDAVFSHLASVCAAPALEEIEREMAPLLARHWNDIHLNAALFARIDTLHEKRAALGLDAENLRVLERYHLDFVRAGAKLQGAARERFAAIAERLAALGTQFSQNVLADEQDFLMPLGEADMADVPAFVRDAAAELARARAPDAPYALSASRSSIEPFLQFSPNRALREKLLRAWTARGANPNAHNNGTVIAQMLALRRERAALLGYPSFAHYRLADTMAGTPQKARALLEQVWTPAAARADEERAALQALIAAEGGNFTLAPWDWRYYAEKLRKARYDLDEAQLQPYFSLENIIAAAFHTAQRLFALDFHERRDIPVYHEDVRVWEVSRGGATIGLFYGDYFARAGKQSGAWMSAFRDQDTLKGPVLPLIVNVCNFARGTPTLLSIDDARTVFHEFGHALHGLLSRVKYPRLSGTAVARDFVELPSQLFEHWLEEPQILERFARHHETGEVLPRALLEKLKAARHFNQGFASVEFLASAFVDMDLHEAQEPAADPAAAQAAALARIAMPGEILPRHSAAHFGHIFSGDGYAAGYYSYLWAEVLDADGFEAFRDTGDIFDPATAKRLHDFIYAAGGTRDFAQSYRAFRGRDPNIDALLEGRGLKDAAS